MNDYSTAQIETAGGASISVQGEGDLGSGRPFIVLYERGAVDALLAKNLFESLSVRSRTLLVSTSSVSGENWRGLSRDLLSFMEERSIRQAGFVTLGATCAVVFAVALSELKLVRSLVTISPTTRPHPTRFEKFVGSLERSLPLGLPLRSSIQDFDAKPYLQRIRCPVLVVSRAGDSAYLQSEAKILSEELPTAWAVPLPEGDVHATLTSSILSFQDVPAKCPQKNR